MNRLLTAFLLTVSWSTASARVIRHTDKDSYPRYAYKYEVYDPTTKDIKDHWEARDGDFVKGSYSLVEPDGKRRVVDYWADDANGFNADVKRLGAGVHVPVVQAAPVTELSQSVSGATPAEPANVQPAPEGQVKPLISPENYGFGSGGVDEPPGGLYTNVGTGSLRWEPETGSYGGWVPLRPAQAHATIFSKKYVDGKLHKWAIGPIALSGRTLVFKVKH